MRKRNCARLAAGFLCAALLFTDMTSLKIHAVSNDIITEQTTSITEGSDEKLENDTNVINDEEEKQDGKSESEESSSEKENIEESQPETEPENPGPSDREEEKSDQETDQEESKSEEEQPEKDSSAEEEEKEEQITEEEPEEAEETAENEETKMPAEGNIGEESVSENTVEEDLSLASVSENALDADAVMLTAAGDIASGSYGNITWVIDANGKLTVRGTGDYSPTTSQRAPWLSNRDFITSAVIDITGITSTALMFEQCSNMTSVDLSKLDTSQVKTMYSMFSGCKSLKRLDLSQFDTSQVSNMRDVFSGCSALEELNLRGLETEQVEDMQQMFYGCSSLKKLDVSSFRTGKVINMVQMFKNCTSLTELDLSRFDTSQVTNMREMFSFCENMKKLNLKNFNTGQVTNMNNMFSYCDSLEALDLSSFDTGNVTDMAWMFCYCSSVTGINLSKFDISRVTSIDSIFHGCKSLIELNLSSFNKNQLTKMENMFSGCYKLSKLDLSHLNTSQVTSMFCMFEDCESLTKLDLSHFDTSQVTNMNSMFSGCKNLERLDLSSFNTEKLSNAQSMFFDCTSLTALDLSNFDFSNVTNGFGMFTNTYLTRIDTPYNIKVSIYLAGLTWYTVDGTEVTEMPKNLDHSVALGLNHIPSAEKPNIPSDDEDETEDKSISKEEKFIEDVTRYSLANASEEKKKEIRSKLYDLMFKAEFAPVGQFTLNGQDSSKTVTFSGSDVINSDWPFQNDSSGGSLIPDRKLGDIDYGVNNKAAGCLSYARFCSKHVHGSVGRPSQEEDKITVKDIKAKIRKWADPGEIIGFNASPPHFVVYLGESKDGDSFYCISYGGGRSKDWSPDHKIRVENFTYEYFVKHYGTERHANIFRVYDTNGGSYSTREDEQTGEAARTNITADGPVEATVELNGEKLDSRNPSTTSFGKVVRNGEQINFDLTYSPNYKLSISGTGKGTMTVTLTNYDKLGNQINQRKFVNVPVKASTEVKSSKFNVVGAFSLFVSDGSGEVDTWSAESGETVSEPENSSLGNPDDDFEDDGTGVHYKDIPENGIIPQGLWISEIPDVVYTGSAIKPEVRVYDGEKRLVKGKDYTISYKNNTKAAQSTDEKPPTVVVKGKGNYSGTETQTFSIAKRDISDTIVTKNFTDAYAFPTNGKNPKLVFSAKCNKKALKKNTDYTLTVKSNSGEEITDYTAEGSYSLVVKGTGANYTGETTLAFEVLNKIPASKLKVGKIAAVEYDGKSKRPAPVIKYGKATLTKGTDYSLRYQNNREIGTATIVITGKGDYFGTKKVTFKITGRQIKNAKFTGFQNAFPYTGDTVYQTRSVLRYGEEEMVMGTDYTVSYGNHLNKGKATVTYIGIGNYTGTLKKTYQIAAYDIAADTDHRISLAKDEISVAYEKGGAKPSVQVYDGTLLLTEGKDYTLSYQNNKAVASATAEKPPTIIVKGKGNYKGMLAEKKTFTIAPKSLAEITVTAPDMAAGLKIGGYKSIPTLTDGNGKKLQAGTDYEKTYTYAYRDTTERVICDEAEVTRNAGAPVEENDIIPANTILCVCIKAKEGGNYTGETTAEYRMVATPINKAKITVQNPSQDYKNLFPYTGQEIRIEKSNLIVQVGEDTLTADQYEILEGTYKNNINKGTASVQIKGTGNLYGGTATVKFKIGTKGFQWFWRLFG